MLAELGLAAAVTLAMSFTSLILFSSPNKEWRILIELLFKMGYNREKVIEILDIYC